MDNVGFVNNEIIHLNGLKKYSKREDNLQRDIQVYTSIDSSMMKKTLGTLQ